MRPQKQGDEMVPSAVDFIEICSADNSDDPRGIHNQHVHGQQQLKEHEL